MKKILAVTGLIFCCVSSVGADLLKNRHTSPILINTKAPIRSITIVNSFPHDREAFTQGIIFHRGFIYESTGLNGKSTLSKVDLKSGNVVKQIKLPGEYFGEGATILGNMIYQLTWQNKVCFVYDILTFDQVGKFNYQGEGWGLTTDGKSLVMSNGSSTLTFRDHRNFTPIGTIIVHDDNQLIENLNELEFIEGEIWANIFTEDIIARISPDTGKVVGWIDLASLSSQIPNNIKIDVLNGIAYDSKNNRIFVTGKNWPKIFEIKVSIK